ncbi:RICIN domain-containing protein [Streptomyces vinaceus]|uniref:RICIN domain-containing protein n=1 Tax=Streptomyces vinaceus TaxID=1960 RepID=UPI0036C536B3
MSTEEEATPAGESSTSEQVLGPDPNAVVCSWANSKSRLRMGILRESIKDGAEIHQALPTSRQHQQWRLIEVGKDGKDVVYKFENVRSQKVLEVAADSAAGAAAVQRSYEGDDAHHQQWKLIPVGSETSRVYEIVNRKSGLFLRTDSNAAVAVKLGGPEEGEPQQRQWQQIRV